MQDMNNKTTGGGAPNGVVTSDEFNQFASESQNVIEDTGQTLSNLDLDQLGKGISVYSSSGDFYVDSGVADAYALSATGSKQSPPTALDGMRARFIPTNSNTGGSATVNVASLGVESIKLVGGTVDPPLGSIVSGTEITLIRRSLPSVHWELSHVSGAGVLPAETVTNFVSGGVVYLHEDGSDAAQFVPSSSITEGVFESVGPTGSGATNIYDAMDDMPEGASIAIFSVRYLITPTLPSVNTAITMYSRATGSTIPAGVQSKVFQILQRSDASLENLEGIAELMVPMDSSRRFDVQWEQLNTTLQTLSLRLKGFVVPGDSGGGGGGGGGGGALPPPAVTGYSSGSTTYVNDTGGDATRIFITSAVTISTSETIGPTGSGADNIWTAMDSLPAGATGIHVGILMSMTLNLVGAFAEMELFARNGAGLASSTDEQTVAYIFSDGADGSAYKGYSSAIIPLDGSRRFSAFWESSDTGLVSIALSLKGFMVDT